MGTGHLTCVFVGGQFKVAQYGQWDGYPEGQGTVILEFLRTLDEKGREAFATKVKALQAATSEELKALWQKFGAKEDGMVEWTDAKRFGQAYPEFSRDTGAEILNLINTGNIEKVSLDLEFAQDSLFCEFAYVVDFDRGSLEVYKGFQTKPALVVDKFGGPDSPNKRGYYPVAKVCEFNLWDLPEKSGFLEVCKAACGGEES